MEDSKQLSELRQLKQSLPSLRTQTICKSDEFDNQQQEAIRMKMGELIKEMADRGLNPKLIFGKGNVKKQRERYKKRVVDEQRFKCSVCNKVFSGGSSMKHHTSNKICEKPVQQTEYEKQMKKQYYENNKDRIKEQKKQYREQQKLKKK